MIATDEAVDVLRHGWQDAATTLAEDVPEVAELLHARLEMAISTGRLDEHNLLDTIEEVESLTCRGGRVSSQALARRLRRTVYEYLLALDAARPSESARSTVEPAATAPGSAMVGADEVAALGHVPTTHDPDAQTVASSTAASAEAVASAVEDHIDAANSLAPSSEEDELDAADDAQPPGAQSSRRRFALRRRQRLDGDPSATDREDVGAVVAPMAEPAEAAEAAEAADPDALTQSSDAPEWRYTAAGEPAVFDNQAGHVEAATSSAGVASAETADETRGRTASADTSVSVEPEPGTQPPAADAEPGAGPELSAGQPGTEREAAEATTATGFVAPRAGFHIVDDATVHRVEAAGEAQLEMPAFSADEPTAGRAEPPEASPPTSEHEAEFITWAPSGGAPPETSQSPARDAEPAQATPMSPPVPAGPQQQLVAPTAHPEAAEPVDSDDDPHTRGWGVRRPGEARSGRRGGHTVTAPPIEDDPFETSSRLADIRRRIEDRLRKKRCDEAAALLQELAQEAGGRAVAELAMNAGDRCRALGKANAALNCYLAAARSDPVYEMPLSRLADICIDNQDTELAVSYLERIARLYRYRGDDKAAIRMYRRIATVAPYRDDVLGLLMNAQRTGRLE